MIFRILSDLHLEFTENTFEIERDELDKDTCLILAGDIHVGRQATKRIREWAKGFKYIIYIAGNHEYYNNVVEYVNTEIENELCDLENVFFLSRQTGSYVELEDDYVIWGDTLWTSLTDPYEFNLDYFIRNAMNDFRIISRINYGSGKTVKFDPDCWRYYHKKSFKDLLNVLKIFHNKKVIVVSHHAPSEQSSSSRFRGTQLQPAYFTPLEGIICNHPQIKLWVHGHMHNTSNYKIGETTVVCNPYGYAGYETNPDFENNFKIEL